MIRMFVGENSFEVSREVQRVIADFQGTPEKIEGTDLSLKGLPDLLMGTSLFGERRLVIIKGLSENSVIWDQFGDWIDRMSDDISLILVDTKPDKRTKTYKTLQKLGVVKEFSLWSDRDLGAVVKWTVEEAKLINLDLSPAMARELVLRAGFDQWDISHALEKLSLADTVSIETMDEIIDKQFSESVFDLLEIALRRDKEALRKKIDVIKRTEDVYKTFGLLSTQILQLAALVYSGKSSAELAPEIGAHPFVLKKLAPFAKGMNTAQAKLLVNSAAETDVAIKSTSIEPWILVEKFLLEVATF